MPATPEAKLHGKHLIVEWLPTGGTAPADLLTMSTYSRNFSVKQSGKEIDVSTRADIAAGTKDVLTDAPDRAIELSGLDSDDATPDWEAIDIDDTGTLTWYRQGKGAGKKKKSCTARCTSSDFGSPHDNANDWKIGWSATSAITTASIS